MPYGFELRCRGIVASVGEGHLQWTPSSPDERQILAKVQLLDPLLALLHVHFSETAFTRAMYFFPLLALALIFCRRPAWGGCHYNCLPPLTLTSRFPTPSCFLCTWSPWPRAWLCGIPSGTLLTARTSRAGSLRACNPAVTRIAA